MRQTAIADGTSVRSSRQSRLDPLTLPVRYAASFGDADRRAETTVFLDRREAIVKRQSAIGAPLTLRMPLNAFEGVAVRMRPIGEAGDIEVVVELRHRDPALSLPLLIADDPADVADDWLAWGEALKLPLLIVDENGEIIPTPGQDSPLISESAKPRRRHSHFADRRPRFLARRKKGQVGGLERLTAREIIARN